MEKTCALKPGWGQLANHKHDRTSQTQTELVRDIADISKRTKIMTERHEAQYGLSGDISQQAIEYQEFLRQLSTLDFTAKQKESYSKRHAKTGQWLLESPDFQTWQQSNVGPSSVLWCPGNPGAGKTIITSIAVNHIIESMNGRRDAVVYIYCDYANKETRSVVQLLGSMVRQLIVQTSHAEVVSELRAFLGQIAKNRNMTEDELSSWTENLSRNFDMVYIFVDALDEIPEMSRDSLLTRLQQLSSDNIRIFLTGRPHIKVEAIVPQAMTAEIAATDRDIANFLTSKIEESKRLVRIAAKDPELRQQILNKIVIQADGLFLLATLQLESLSNQTSIRGVRSALERLPTTFPPMYDQTIQRIRRQPPEHSEVAMQVLKVIFGATRPLEVDEVRHALATQPWGAELDFEALIDDVDLLSVTAGLVITYQDDDHHQKLFRLVHYTLQQYLETNQDVLFPDLASYMATRCVSYLSFDEFGGGQCTTEEMYKNRKAKFRFLEYAACNWAHHLREVQLEIMEQSIAFLQDSMKTSAWLQCFEDLSGWDHGLSSSKDLPLDALFVAAHFDLSEIFMSLIPSRDINTRNKRGETPLLRAVDVRPWQKGESSALDMSHQLQQPHNRRESFYSRFFGENQCAIVLVILNCNADINARDPLGRTALFRAVRNENFGVVSLLLDRGADTSVRSDDGYSLLHVAAMNQQRVDIMEFLLNKYADINILTENGESLVHVAAGLLNPVMLDYLVDSGAPMDTADRQGVTPLLYAASQGRFETASALVKRGANLNFTDRLGKTALHIALAPRFAPPRLDIIELLSRKQIINRRDLKGRTPLHHAYFRSAQLWDYFDEEWDSEMAVVIERLIAVGASEDVADADGRVPKDYLSWTDRADKIRWKQDYLDLSDSLTEATKLQGSNEIQVESISKPAEDLEAHEENEEEQPQGDRLLALVE